jgi:NAD(P)-dependent dehydrogenase (short-subunit alcohol dehydrogenase family)
MNATEQQIAGSPNRDALSGRVVVVTGASAGIGEATARLAAKHGARLVLAARRTGRLEALAADLGEAVTVQTDMRDPAQIQRMADRAVSAYGTVDVLVNNAGQGLHVPIEKIRLEDLAAITELNFYGPLLAIQMEPSATRPSVLGVLSPVPPGQWACSSVASSRAGSAGGGCCG